MTARSSAAWGRRACLGVLSLSIAACSAAPGQVAKSRTGAAKASAAALDMGAFVHSALQRADVDRDGVLSGPESGLDAAQFRTLDRNADGVIDAAELNYQVSFEQAEAMSEPFRPMVDATLARLDGDGDRQINGDELRRMAAPDGSRVDPLRANVLEAALRKADADGDGVISEREHNRFYLALGTASTTLATPSLGFSGLTESATASSRGVFSRIVEAMLGGYLSVTSRIAFGIAFHPKRVKADVTPAKFGIPFEEVSYTTEDGIPIKGWFIPAAVPTEHTVIAIHGITSNRSHYVRQKQVAWLNPYVNMLIPDLRNQGESGGDRTTYSYEEGRDVVAAYRYLQSRGIHSAMVYGTSLGGSTAIRGAALVPELKGVVDECTYATVFQAVTSFASLAFVPSPVLIASATMERAKKAFGFDLADTDTITQVGAIAPRPLMIIHGAADRNVPPEASRLLYLAAGTGFDKSLWLVPNAPHAVSAEVAPKEYEAKLVAMVKRTFGIAP